MADQEEDQGITAYHGSPHEFEQFDLSKIGTGEGAQAYGHGLYFAENEPTAQKYRDDLAFKSNAPKLRVGDKIYPVKMGGDRTENEELLYRLWKATQSGKIDYGSAAGPEYSDEMIDTALSSLNRQSGELHDWAEKELKGSKQIDTENNGHMYEVSINAHPDHFLDWDKPFDEQSPHIKKTLTRLVGSGELRPAIMNLKGENIHSHIQSKIGGGPEQASQFLHDNGIKGIKYLDAGSRGKTDKPTRNYVVFDNKLVNVKRRYAQGGEVDREGLAIGGNPGDLAGGGFGTGNVGGGSSIGSGGGGSANPGDLAGGGFGTGNIGGGSSTGGGGGGGSSFNSVGGGGRDSSSSIDRNASVGGADKGPGLGFGGAEVMSPLGGLSNGIPMAFPDRSQDQMLRAMGIEGPIDASGLPSALRPGGNIGASLAKEALTPDLSTANSPLASGVQSYDQNAINALYDRMREEQQAARDAAYQRSVIGPVTKEINVPNAGDLYGATDAPLAVNQKPSGMFGQPEFGTTEFGQSPMQSGFPKQLSVPPITGEEARQGDVPGMSQETLDWNRKFDEMQRQNQSLFSPETNQAVNSATNKFLSAMREMPAKLQEAQPLLAASKIPLIGGMIAKSYGLEEATPAESAALFNKIYGNQPTLGQNLDWSFGQRAGSMGSMPSGAQQYASDLTPVSSQPARPITPTPSTSMMPTSRQTETASPAVKQTVRDNFNSAFAAARSRGDQTFSWTNPATGQTSIYTTQLERKNGGRIPSFAEPDEWLAEKNESKKPERGAVAKRSGVLSSSKS